MKKLIVVLSLLFIAGQQANAKGPKCWKGPLKEAKKSYLNSAKRPQKPKFKTIPKGPKKKSS